MMKTGSTFSTGTLLVLLASQLVVEAAPAPIEYVTVYQTATATANGDGTYDTFIDPTSTSATVAAASTTEAATNAAATTSDSSSSSTSGWSLDKLLSNGYIEKWLSKFTGSRSSSSSSSNTGSTTTTSQYHGFLWSLLHGGDSSSISVTSATSTPTSTSTPAFTTSDTESPTETTSISTSTSSSSSSSGDVYAAFSDCDDLDELFAKDILDAHNKYRALHGSGDLSWDVDTYNYAKNNADNYDCSGILTHTHGEYGENLAAGYQTGSSAVKAWYDEGESYNYNLANTYDHFTQVVWKGSTKVGCAYKDCSAEGWAKYIVCEYDPAGNIIGQNKANVLPS